MGCDWNGIGYPLSYEYFNEARGFVLKAARPFGGGQGLGTRLPSSLLSLSVLADLVSHPVNNNIWQACRDSSGRLSYPHARFLSVLPHSKELAVQSLEQQLTEKKAVVADLSSQLQLHKTNFDSLKEELTQVASYTIESRDSYYGASNVMKTDVHSLISMLQSTPTEYWEQFARLPALTS